MEVTQGIVTVVDTGYHMLYFCQSLFLSLLTEISFDTAAPKNTGLVKI